LAAPERLILNWLCARVPPFLTPDRLTFLGSVGAVLVCAGGALSGASVQFLWLMILGLLINWVGDSLDGSLARFRGIARPNYGYFIDHAVDGLNNLLIAVGLGLTPSVHLDVSLFALCTYYLLCMYVFLRRQVLDELRLSYLWIGPTELRILIGANIIGMHFAPAAFIAIGGKAFSLYDVLILLTATIFLVLYIYLVSVTGAALRRSDHL